MRSVSMQADRTALRLSPDALSLALLLVVFSLIPIAAAGTLRCGDNLIQRGFTFFEVLERCGRPDLEYAWDRRYVPGVEARVTEWVYDQGPNRFRRVLRFEEGRLREVELRPKPEVSLDSLDCSALPPPGAVCHGHLHGRDPRFNPVASAGRMSRIRTEPMHRPDTAYPGAELAVIRIPV